WGYSASTRVRHAPPGSVSPTRRSRATGGLGIRSQPGRGALAYWLWAPGGGGIRPARLPAPSAGGGLGRTPYTGISRGTETLVFRGEVPASQYRAMRAPFQEGDFPAPVKYGYLNVGVVEAGPAALLGRTVFCLYPHQTRYVVPAEAVTVVPDA